MPGIKVKLLRSIAGRSADQRATLQGMGLYRIGQERILPDNAASVGMCEKMTHMVAWERVSVDPVKRQRRTRKAAQAAK